MDENDLTIADLPTLKEFKKECEAFAGNMKKSMEKLEDSLKVVRQGWKDEGFDGIRRMTEDVRHNINDIESKMKSKVVPYVDEVIKWLEGQPK